MEYDGKQEPSLAEILPLINQLTSDSDGKDKSSTPDVIKPGQEDTAMMFHEILQFFEQKTDFPKSGIPEFQSKQKNAQTSQSTKAMDPTSSMDYAVTRGT